MVIYISPYQWSNFLIKSHRLIISGEKVGEKISQENEAKKQASVAILKSNKIDFKIKLIKRDVEGHYILTKGNIYQDDISTSYHLFY